MSEKNRYLTAQAAAFGSPITFTTTAGAASANAAMTTVRANLDLIIAQLEYEGTDASVNRFFLDEMSPQARITLYKIITDLKTLSPNP
ncbi:hypothetical protein Bpfe_031111 [Biomphalaria pfeifferi]|uniref:Uncharacterized protein n=1 Tax=Biomphalaria pfeifferi TaxID=112525 RepID=A0AAD8ANE3_BIOPF|nr:hypothetical protein Bpfe_031111 [Biomphalaria pfeifferi]